MAEEFPEFEVEFVEFLVQQEALQFGSEWTLKSGRKSPYFLNMGSIDNGPALNRLGESYAALIAEKIDSGEIQKPTYLWGPAYKGINLAAATAMFLDSEYGITVTVGSDRKESKTHGEGTGVSLTLLGAKPTAEDRILIIEDVFTTGKTKEEAHENISSFVENPAIDGVIIALDRAETSVDGSDTAIAAFKEKYGIPTFSVTDIYRVRELLHNREVGGAVPLNDENKARLDDYLQKYGTKEAE
ncbi:orotate phosphoribosyltransferase [Candidatus Woesearchaeota archaeon]|nr:orotate phosphoribosyltransferase [Candidatus Woesearchaeota archaeon]